MVADLLPLSAPDTGDWDGALRFEYHYDVLPGSVISRFIVRMHRFISHQTSWCQTYWRRGVVLERDGHGALVKADIEDGIITVAVAGGADERRAMLDLIRADFERNHETIRNSVSPRRCRSPTIQVFSLTTSIWSGSAA